MGCTFESRSRRLLEEALGLSLRVPQTVMLAAYPPGAHYRRHFDSYGGRDIPRYITALLYLGWEPRKGGQLRTYPPVSPARSASKLPPAGDVAPQRDVDPIPGRLCVFFSQEVEHEVMCSDGERFVMTQWVHDVEQDELGR